jgi:hypothetical protein
MYKMVDKLELAMRAIKKEMRNDNITTEESSD